MFQLDQEIPSQVIDISIWNFGTESEILYSRY